MAFNEIKSIVIPQNLAEDNPEEENSQSEDEVEMKP